MLQDHNEKFRYELMDQANILYTSMSKGKKIPYIYIVDSPQIWQNFFGNLSVLKCTPFKCKIY